MKRLFWAGDSTVKENNFTTYPQTGIGQGMKLFIHKDIKIENHAENGRSTKSFIDESRLAVIYDRIREGDLLFIQFGHNDSKKEDPPVIRSPMVNIRTTWKNSSMLQETERHIRY